MDRCQWIIYSKQDFHILLKIDLKYVLSVQFENTIIVIKYLLSFHSQKQIMQGIVQINTLQFFKIKKVI